MGPTSGTLFLGPRAALLFWGQGFLVPLPVKGARAGMGVRSEGQKDLFVPFSLFCTPLASLGPGWFADGPPSLSGHLGCQVRVAQGLRVPPRCVMRKSSGLFPLGLSEKNWVQILLLSCRVLQGFQTRTGVIQGTLGFLAPARSLGTDSQHLYGLPFQPEKGRAQCPHASLTSVSVTEPHPQAPMQPRAWPLWLEQEAADLIPENSV